MLIIALAMAAIGLTALVTAIVSGNEVIAWVCIAASLLGVVLLIVDALAERRSHDAADPVAPDAPPVPDTAPRPETLPESDAPAATDDPATTDGPATTGGPVDGATPTSEVELPPDEAATPRPATS